MMRMKLLAAGVLLLASTGCLTSRSIRQVSESGDRNLTLIQTQDAWTYIPLFWVVHKHQFWTCRESGDALQCNKACDSKNSQLACPTEYSSNSGSNQAANSSSK